VKKTRLSYRKQIARKLRTQHVTMTVSLSISEIFSVKKWPDLEIWVRGGSRSLKMARFDRPCMTFY